jgi:hypothetical protein
MNETKLDHWISEKKGIFEMYWLAANCSCFDQGCEIDRIQTIQDRNFSKTYFQSSYLLIYVALQPIFG